MSPADLQGLFRKFLAHSYMFANSELKHGSWTAQKNGTHCAAAIYQRFITLISLKKRWKFACHNHVQKCLLLRQLFSTKKARETGLPQCAATCAFLSVTKTSRFREKTALIARQNECVSGRRTKTGISQAVSADESSTSRPLMAVPAARSGNFDAA